MALRPSDDRLCIPVPLYHCFGMVLGVLACVRHAARRWCFPARASTPRDTLQRVAEQRCTALHGVPTMFIADARRTRDFAQLRPVEPAHRHHGRRAVPDRDDEAAWSPRCTCAEVTIAYGMTETCPVSFQSSLDDPLERRVVDGRPRPAAPGGEDRRRAGPHRAGRPAGRAVHARLLGDARLLGRRRAHARSRSTPTGWMHSGDLATIDAAGLLQHRRPRQGHADPRRRERLPARDRGVPAAAPEDRRRCRCSACPTRSTARRSAPGSCSSRPAACSERGDPRLLPGPDRALQGAALRPLRRSSSRSPSPASRRSSRCAKR